MKRTFRPAVSPLEDRLALATAAAAAVTPAVPLSMATALVGHLYEDTLGRAPDAVGAAAAIPAIQSGTTAAQLTTLLVTSPEFINRNISAAASGPANGASYVSALYGSVLGRSASPAEVGFWVSAIEARAASLDQVATAIVNSPEAATSPNSILVRYSYANMANDGMSALFRDTLGRNPDPVAVSTIVPEMVAGTTMAQLTTSLVTSTEYINDKISASATGVQNSASYVSSLYATVLGRSASPAEVGFWVSAIEARAASLDQVATAIVNSPEAATSPNSILVRNVL